MSKAMQQGIASPCISVCVMDPNSGYCAGCLRTLDEIALWSVLDDEDKRAVIALLPARRAQSGDAKATRARIDGER